MYKKILFQPGYQTELHQYQRIDLRINPLEFALTPDSREDEAMIYSEDGSIRVTLEEVEFNSQTNSVSVTIPDMGEIPSEMTFLISVIFSDGDDEINCVTPVPIKITSSEQPIKKPFITSVGFQLHKQNISVDECMKDTLVVMGQNFSKFEFDAHILPMNTALQTITKTDTMMYLRVVTKPFLAQDSQKIRIKFDYTYSEGGEMRFGTMMSVPFIDLTK